MRRSPYYSNAPVAASNSAIAGPFTITSIGRALLVPAVLAVGLVWWFYGGGTSSVLVLDVTDSSLDVKTKGDPRCQRAIASLVKGES